MLTKRQFLLGGIALATASFMSPTMASSAALLDDILHGVSDALVREYIREHYREGRWDGSHWVVSDHRYTPHEYAVFLERRYRRHHPAHPMHKGPKHDDHPGRGHARGHDKPGNPHYRGD